MKTTFQWLKEIERAFLLALNPKAEAFINQHFSVSDVTEEKLFPFRPVGTQAYQQGTTPPYLYGADIEIINEKGTGLVLITCPQDHSFTKYEYRNGVLARVRRHYFGEWSKIVKSVMRPALRRLEWAIYELQDNGTPHIYLHCNLPSPCGKNTVSLYVPTSYFASKNWKEVEEFHTRVAVGYYNGKGFRVAPEKLAEWRAMTAAALDCAEAKALRKTVERIKI